MRQNTVLNGFYGCARRLFLRSVVLALVICMSVPALQAQEAKQEVKQEVVQVASQLAASEVGQQDTTDVEQLDAVTVSVANVEVKGSRRVAFPTQKQIDASANGMDLLGKLMLSQLKINPLDNSLSSSDGGTVQLCINGRKATQQEVTALLPADIIKIELEEDPGVRYNDAAILVNYVVRRHEFGGSFSYKGTQSVESLFGNHNVTAKLNKRKSEFVLHYGTNQQYFNDMWSERTELFKFSDGREYHRKQVTQPYKTKWFQHNGYFNYNLVEDKNYALYVTARFSHSTNPNLTEKGKLYTEEFPEDITDRVDVSDKMNFSPSLDVYFEKSLGKRQTLVFNVVGTYIKTDNQKRYKELLKGEPIVDYSSAVQGEKYSLIAEALYEKKFENGGTLTGGIWHNQSYTDNVYGGTLKYNTQMKQAYTFGYVQYAGKAGKKFSYRVGVNVVRSWFRQTAEDDYQTWSVNPKINMSYAFNKNWNVSLNGSMSTVNPTLSQLSAVDQMVDSLQISRGNPGLKPYDYYYSTLRLNYNKGRVNVGLYNTFRYSDSAILDYIYRETNAQGSEKFVYSYANSQDFKQWLVGLDVRVGMFKDMLQLGVGVSNSSYWSNGVNYNHHYNSLGINAQAAFMYKKFTFVAMYQKEADNLWGEELNTAEELHLLQAQYKIKNVLVGLSVLNPFRTDFYRNTDNLNKYAGNTYRYHIDDAARMICLELSWNFGFGRQYKKSGRRLDNTDTDSGVM